MSDKKLKVIFEHGEVFYIPAILVARHRASYYAGKATVEDYQDTYDGEVDFAMTDDYELIDWATNSMDWADVKDSAILVDHVEADLDEDWVSANKSIESPPSKPMEH